MKRILCVIALLIGPPATAAAGFDHGVWDGLLQRHVVMIDRGHASQVDYKGMGTERAALKNYLEFYSYAAWENGAKCHFGVEVYDDEKVLKGDADYDSSDLNEDYGFSGEDPVYDLILG